MEVRQEWRERFGCEVTFGVYIYIYIYMTSMYIYIEVTCQPVRGAKESESERESLVSAIQRTRRGAPLPHPTRYNLEIIVSCIVMQ